MFTLQAAMLATFADESADPLTRQHANALTAVVVLAAVTAIAVWMIVKGTVNLRRLRAVGSQGAAEEERRTAE